MRFHGYKYTQCPLGKIPIILLCKGHEKLKFISKRQRGKGEGESSLDSQLADLGIMLFVYFPTIISLLRKKEAESATRPE